jgi:hypothetical protein
VTIADIFGLSETQERALVRPMGITNKTSVLRLLARQKIKADNRKTVLELLKQINVAADKMNDLAHGFYGHKNSEFTILSFSGAANLTWNAVDCTPQPLEHFVMNLRHLRSELSHVRTLFPKSLR